MLRVCNVCMYVHTIDNPSAIVGLQRFSCYCGSPVRIEHLVIIAFQLFQC